MNSFFSWVGGKKALRDLIYERLPSHYDRYIEVFGGAAWVLFGLEHCCELEVYNDYNANLTNMFRCVRERPLSFIQELGFLPLTSRDEFTILKRFLERKEFRRICPPEELEIAAKALPAPEAEEIIALLRDQVNEADIHRATTFFKVIRYSYASKGVSFGCKSFDIYKAFSLIWAANRRLRNTLIENQDFARLLRHYDSPSAFFYLDPPYFMTEDYYADVGFTSDDHMRLKESLLRVKGKWLLSYNDDPFIRDLYAGFHIESVERLDNMAQRYSGGKVYREVLISNYDTTQREKSRPVQISLFEVGGPVPPASVQIPSINTVGGM